MIEKLEELKTKCELMLKYSNKLKRITNEINAKASKRFILVIYVALFFILYTTLVARYFVFSHSANYNLVQLLISSFLVALLFTTIITAVLFVPITLFLKIRRKKAYNKEKSEIESILENIKELYTSLNDYPASLLNYLSPFYLNKLIDYLKEDERSIDEAIDKLRKEKYNNESLQYSVNAANKRMDNFNHLFDLSVKEGATETYEDWMKYYTAK